jgi:hypothetical protein
MARVALRDGEATGAQHRHGVVVGHDVELGHHARGLAPQLQAAALPGLAVAAV